MFVVREWMHHCDSEHTATATLMTKRTPASRCESIASSLKTSEGMEGDREARNEERATEAASAQPARSSFPALPVRSSSSTFRAGSGSTVL